MNIIEIFRRQNALDGRRVLPSFFMAYDAQYHF